MVSWSGVSWYSKSSGTGRTAEVTFATATPVARSRRSAIGVMSPRVADMRRKRVFVSVMSGTCQAQPRSASE